MNLKKLTKKVPFYRHYKVFFFIQLSNSRVTAIIEGGRDYEVTVAFDTAGTKKMFAAFAKLEKI